MSPFSLVDEDIISTLACFGNLANSSRDDKVHVALITAVVIATLNRIRVRVVSPAGELFVADAASVLLFGFRHSLGSFLLDVTYNVMDVIDRILRGVVVIKLFVSIATVICLKVAPQDAFDLVLESIVVELFGVVSGIRHGCSP